MSVNPNVLLMVVVELVAGRFVAKEKFVINLSVVRLAVVMEKNAAMMVAENLVVLVMQQLKFVLLLGVTSI